MLKFLDVLSGSVIDFSVGWYLGGMGRNGCCFSCTDVKLGGSGDEVGLNPSWCIVYEWFHSRTYFFEIDVSVYDFIV